MTAFEKLLAGLVLVYFLSHAVLRLGSEAGVPGGLVSVAEALATH